MCLGFKFQSMTFKEHTVVVGATLYSQLQFLTCFMETVFCKYVAMYKVPTYNF